MKLIKWNDLPEHMRTVEVKYYYDILKKRQISLFFKRLFDILMAFLLILVLSPLMIFLALLIKFDSPGPIFYRQQRATQYGRVFRIYKFRTMINDADKCGTHVTLKDDRRITDVGKRIRNLRLDEIPQLFNILCGDMSFVGSRPEALKYVRSYTSEMVATHLLPAGVTSTASIEFKDEAKILESAMDADQVYIEKILPEKMKYNLEELEHFSLFNDMKVLVRTFYVIIRG